MISNREFTQPKYESFGDVPLVITKIKTKLDVKINIKDNFNNVEIINWLTTTPENNKIRLSIPLLSQLKRAHYEVIIYNEEFMKKVLLHVK